MRRASHCCLAIASAVLAAAPVVTGGCSGSDGTKTWSGPFGAVAAEREATCAVTSKGEIECWGEGRVARNTERPAGPFRDVAIDGSSGVGLRPDGTLAGWGSSAPPSGHYSMISAGHDACALRDDGDLDCWPLGGRRGKSETRTGPFTHVSLGGLLGCAVRADGSIECWGHCVATHDRDAIDCPARVPAPEGRYVEVASAGDFACALAVDGSITCWGDMSKVTTPPPTGAGWTKLSARDDTACAIDGHAEIVCWGAPVYWGTRVYTPPPGPFTAVSVGGRHVCGLHADGKLSCWGVDQQGQVSGSAPWPRT
jgi:hypothetical protein